MVNECMDDCIKDNNTRKNRAIPKRYDAYRNRPVERVAKQCGYVVVTVFIRKISV